MESCAFLSPLLPLLSSYVSFRFRSRPFRVPLPASRPPPPRACPAKPTTDLPDSTFSTVRSIAPRLFQLSHPRLLVASSTPMHPASCPPFSTFPPPPHLAGRRCPTASLPPPPHRHASSPAARAPCTSALRPLSSLSPCAHVSVPPLSARPPGLRPRPRPRAFRTTADRLQPPPPPPQPLLLSARMSFRLPLSSSFSSPLESSVTDPLRRHTKKSTAKGRAKQRTWRGRPRWRAGGSSQREGEIVGP